MKVIFRARLEATPKQGFSHTLPAGGGLRCQFVTDTPCHNTPLHPLREVCWLSPKRTDVKTIHLKFLTVIHLQIDSRFLIQLW